MTDPEKAEATNEVDIDEEEELEDDDKDTLTSQLMKNPEVLAALQSKLGNMVGSTSGYIQSLPKVVKRRIKALKKLQLECAKIEAKFFEEVHSLECKYASLYEPLYDKRVSIVAGSIEPNDDECDFPSDDEDEDLAEDAKDKIKIEEEKNDADKNNESEGNPSGVPEFWLTIFKNVEMTAEMIQEHDEPILKSLRDVKVTFSESNPMGFKLLFYFDENEHFTNSVLTKEYEMKCYPDESDPFSFEGPEIHKCKGSTIDWNKGKNITVRQVKKKQKHKSRGSVRTVTKTVQSDSFFNFFSPPEVPDDDDDATADEETQALLSADFEIGHFIRERIVPRAVLYFTGEALQDDDDFEDEDEDEEEGDENEDEEDDPDFEPQKGKEKPPECKQQ